MSEAKTSIITEVIQDFLDRYRMTKLDQLDWITRNRLRVKQHKRLYTKSIKKQKELPNRQKILVWATGAWERGGLEHMLAFSLLLRGHEICGVQCDGGFPACSMGSLHFPRPECEACFHRSNQLLDIFQLGPYYSPIGKFLSSEDKAFCDREIDYLPQSQFRNYTYKGIPVGKNAERDLPQHYFRVLPIDSPEEEGQIRKILKATLMYTVSAFNAVEHFKPDRCVVTSGKTIAYGPFFEVCKKLGVPVMTWEENPNGQDAFVFKYNHYASEYHLDDAWNEYKKAPYKEEERETAIRFYANNALGKLARRTFYNDPIRDRKTIQSQLNLDPSKKLLVMLTNLTWDTSCLGRDVAFDSMLDWIFKTLDYLKDKSDVQIVIRAHPAEKHCPDFMKSMELVPDLIRQHYSTLPKNVRIVDGGSEINSHILCSLSDLITVYSTTVGLEMTMRGIPVVVCGQCHYSRRGFTYDIEEQKAYFNLLDKLCRSENLKLSKEAQQLSFRYANFFIKHVPAYLPYFDFSNRHVFEIENPKDFLPGHSKNWDNICEQFLKQGLMTNMTSFHRSLPKIDDKLMKLWNLE